MDHDHSVLRHSPDEGADYGVALCWAENAVGAQREPCRFRIVRESSPERLRDCRAENVTWEVRKRPQ